MADNNPLQLPGDFQPGKSGLQRHDLMLDWRRALVADRAVAGPGLAETQTPQGRILRVDGELGGGAISGPGAFYKIFTDEADHTYLQGGTVTGGSGTLTVAQIKIIDATTGPIAPSGHHLYLDITGNGYEEDDVLLPGFDLTGSPTTSTGASVPDNTLPEAGSVSGKKVFVSLGMFIGEAFSPADTGNVQISFCPGSYRITRQ